MKTLDLIERLTEWTSDVTIRHYKCDLQNKDTYYVFINRISGLGSVKSFAGKTMHIALMKAYRHVRKDFK